MTNYTLEITLESDTQFGMGAGISGSVDSEIQHLENGLPYISGRAVKGLLVNECSELLYALGEPEKWVKAAGNLFGRMGDMEKQSILSFGDGSVAPDLAAKIDPQQLSPQDVLESLTDIRWQTAMTESGAPKDDSLRAVRVLIRGLTFYVPFSLSAGNEKEEWKCEKALLSACVLSLRRAGLNRSRGTGKVKARITNRPLNPAGFSTSVSKDLTQNWFKMFAAEVNKK